MTLDDIIEALHSIPLTDVESRLLAVNEPLLRRPEEHISSLARTGIFDLLHQVYLRTWLEHLTAGPAIYVENKPSPSAADIETAIRAGHTTTVDKNHFQQAEIIADKLYPWPRSASGADASMIRLKRSIVHETYDVVKPQIDAIVDANVHYMHALKLIAGFRHFDRSCSLEAQGYSEADCARIGAQDDLAGMAKDALKGEDVYYTPKQIHEWREKAKKWDGLGEYYAWVKATERLPAERSEVIAYRLKGQDVLTGCCYFQDAPNGAKVLLYPAHSGGNPYSAELKDVEWLEERTNTPE